MPEPACFGWHGHDSLRQETTEQFWVGVWYIRQSTCVATFVPVAHLFSLYSQGFKQALGLVEAYLSKRKYLSGTFLSTQHHIGKDIPASHRADSYVQCR